ncbi:dsRNA-specific ribonuclease [Wolbachia endosymbiont strain TRS of Brugia malayi]|uniref:Ribonuclease 3 n=2 Tax=unclassified Wolbachia TaxID=2640676 RepID=RNC_WOLTR|nr:RecName: Full=Ribonuclease 3; AltName: Full=Ribonuclease III; Short=RNase III [Wolbachia endosymbiont strain TRS of Brugia malayi]AAW70691.1 dsRNA-specific ribonuclease [Wolbachia endosymbiont strain TRS of Brugia malayi]
MGDTPFKATSMEDLNDTISKIINYRFKNDAILEEALTHPSLNKRNSKNQIENYERLEFLGDSILNMIVSAILFRLFPKEKEGALARRKTDLVCGNTIANVAKEIKLGNFIIMNNSERCNGGKRNLKNLENALEALIGAIYIDGGFANVKKFVTKHWEERAKGMLSLPQDPKTSLQEWTQKNKLPLPEYELMKQTGPAHSPEFTISICIENYGKVFACASSKKVAEQKAAELMLEKINNSEKTI